MENNNNKSPIEASILKPYGTMLVCLFVLTSVGISGVLAWTYGIYKSDQSSGITLLYVLVCGALGGFVSSLTRLYRLSDLPELLKIPDIGKLKLSGYIMVYSLVPPLVGIIAAAFTYFVFASDFIQGDLFPKFMCSGKNPNDAISCIPQKQGETCNCSGGIKGLFNNYPNSVKDTARALVWGFISGFSERFLPGIINNLSNRTDTDK